MSHPCVKCGACCAVYRVSFHWMETHEDSFHVPVEMTSKLNAHLLALKKHSGNMRCLALEGKIGTSVRCKIYDNRPSPCRNFKASYEDGTHNQRCDDSRKAMGLLPLTPEVWVESFDPDTASAELPR